MKSYKLKSLDDLNNGELVVGYAGKWGTPAECLVENTDSIPDKFKELHPRAVKLLEKGKEFLVVACDEPYYEEVYRIIRAHEIHRGTWTHEDEQRYLAKVGVE